MINHWASPWARAVWAPVESCFKSSEHWYLSAARYIETLSQYLPTFISFRVKLILLSMPTLSIRTNKTRHFFRFLVAKSISRKSCHVCFNQFVYMELNWNPDFNLLKVKCSGGVMKNSFYGKFVFRTKCFNFQKSIKTWRLHWLDV